MDLVTSKDNPKNKQSNFSKLQKMKPQDIKFTDGLLFGSFLIFTHYSYTFSIWVLQKYNSAVLIYPKIVHRYNLKSLAMSMSIFKEYSYIY